MSDIHNAADNSPSQQELSQLLADATATLAFGAALAPAVLCEHAAGLVIWLCGNLGAGKTTTTRGLLHALGHSGNVKSPTYTLLEPYTVSRITLYHFDFYRFNDPEEFLDAGLEEYFSDGGICLVEWADKALPYVPQPDVELCLAVENGARRVAWRALTERGRLCLSHTSLNTPTI